MYKYRLEEKKAELYAKSDHPVSKTFKIFIYGSCSDVEEVVKKRDRIEACKIGKTIEL